jgi:hypothetical protein
MVAAPICDEIHCTFGKSMVARAVALVFFSSVTVTLTVKVE